MINFINFIYWFIVARYIWKFNSNKKLIDHQKKQLRKFFINIQEKKIFNNVSFENFNKIQTLNKKDLISNFEKYNTPSLSYDECLNFGKKQEQKRDFTGSIDGFSVGLSSGTSGVPGVFITTKKEQTKWSGIVLGKMLPLDLIFKNIITLKKIKIVLILRNSNNLYKSLNGLLFSFEYIDLIKEHESYIDKLNKINPTILVAPATVLLNLAHQKNKNNNIFINPKMIISVAEVLESKEFISKVFNQPIKEIYQATEGFLGYTCKYNNLHLNESFMLIEKENLDDKHFNPIITDFSRDTQLIMRYKHDDILMTDEHICKCGSAEKIIKKIVGRNDEIIQIDGRVIFPDQIRQIFFSMKNTVEDYIIEFYGEKKIMSVSFSPYSEETAEEIKMNLNKLINNNEIILNVKKSDLILIGGAKKIRIRNLK